MAISDRSRGRSTPRAARPAANGSTSRRARWAWAARRTSGAVSERIMAWVIGPGPRAVLRASMARAISSNRSNSRGGSSSWPSATTAAT